MSTRCGVGHVAWSIPHSSLIAGASGHCVSAASGQESAITWNHVGTNTHLSLLTTWPLRQSLRWAGCDPMVTSPELCSSAHGFLMVQIEVSLLPLLVRRSNHAGLGWNRHWKTTHTHTPPKSAYILFRKSSRSVKLPGLANPVLAKGDAALEGKASWEKQIQAVDKRCSLQGELYRGLVFE